MSDSGYFRKVQAKVAGMPSKAAPPSVPDDSQVVAAAAQIGFVDRNPASDADIETRQTLGPVVMMTMRVPVRVARQFKRFAKDNRYSYWEAIEELMKRAGA